MSTDNGQTEILPHQQSIAIEVYTEGFTLVQDCPHMGEQRIFVARQNMASLVEAMQRYASKGK